MKRLDSGFRRNDVRGFHTRAEGLKLMALGPTPGLNILTKSPTHPHGIKVRLESGVVGRVRKILSEDP